MQADAGEQLRRAAGRRRRRTGRPACPRGSPAPRRRTSGRRSASRSRRRPACASARARSACSRRRRRRTRPAPASAVERRSPCRSQWQPQLPPQQPPPGRRPPPGCGSAWPVPMAANTENCCFTFFDAAVGARRGLVVADELLEVRLAAHADVFVDRHRGSQPYQAASVTHDARDRALRVGRTRGRLRLPVPGIRSRNWSLKMTDDCERSPSCGGARARCGAARPSASCRRWARSTPATRRSSRRRASECDVVVASVFVNPAQFSDDARPRRRTRATSRRDERVAAAARRRLPLRAVRRRALPARLRDLGRAGRRRRRARGRAPPRPLPRRRDRLREALHDRPAATSRTSGARTRSRSRS